MKLLYYKYLKKKKKKPQYEMLRISVLVFKLCFCIKRIYKSNAVNTLSEYCGEMRKAFQL